MESNEHLNILLDIQKQLGALGKETSMQSQMIISLNEKVAVANGRTTKNEAEIAKMKSILDNWKGKLAVILVMGGVVGKIVLDFIRKQIGL